MAETQENLRSSSSSSSSSSELSVKFERGIGGVNSSEGKEVDSGETSASGCTVNNGHAESSG